MFPIRDHNPSLATPVVTYGIIGLNLLVFLYQYALGTDTAAAYDFLARWALFPALVSQGEGFPALVSHMFLHAGLLHLAGNMLFLWIFGDNLEDQMGHFGFLLFYLACGLAAAFGQILPDPQSDIPMVGASGAIAGVMGGYLLLFPRARVDILVIFILFFRIFQVPAWLMLGLWFALQIFGGLGTPSAGGGVAYWAHAAGFLAGILLTRPTFLRRGAGGWWQANQGRPPHPELATSPLSIPLVRRRK
ncbi:MAG: rhomboid family intramembrane serine protease [Rhodobacteraceae bacterium]|nr:rhomboid family intramembrane serine protease [Paracoccaceae bacterium]